MNIKFLTALAALGLGLAACGQNEDNVHLTPQPPFTGLPGSPTGPAANTKFTQIERLSRPAIKEVFENFVDHQKSNAVEPYQDDLLKTDIAATEDFVRYASATGPASGPDYGKIIQSVVYPDEYTVDLAQTTGGFLGNETGGAVAGKFGGRNIDDDVIGTELYVLFGTAISDLKLAPADNKQNNCLSTQNLPNPGQGQKSLAVFPYLPNPH
ncbi:MAG: hypothetical protein NVS2B3_00060 [Vulcanimicrobiaceae bacterium]